MFTDMVGFTGRTQDDEAGTLALLREQEALLRPILEAHRGRAVKSTGDGFLVEFPSALQAAECAVAIQERLRERNARPGVATIDLRIGIHLGDVEQRGDDIFGDAVNLAARVQPTADPGGVAVSQQVYDQVRNKLPLALERLGPQTLKGVRFPMDVYRIVLPGTESTVGGPESARIAVLPFANISPDPHDAYISDGLTEELITALSQLQQLRVIARTSVEPYRAAPKPVAQVGTELGVTWVLEGSVRKANTRLRITVQLIEARTQVHLWSETYNRELDDVFALQSEMARKVAEALKIQLFPTEAARLERRSPLLPESYLEYLRGRARMHGIREDDLTAARAHFEHAIALDDRNAAAHAGLSDLHRILGGMYHHLPRSQWDALARAHAARALELDPDLAEAHTSLGMAAWDDYDFAGAEREFRTAVSINPSSAWARQWLGDLLADRGQWEEGLREMQFSEELDPLSALVLAGEIPLLLDLRRLDEARTKIEHLGDVEGRGILYHDAVANLCLVEDDASGLEREVEALDRALPGRPEIPTARALICAMRGEGDRAREFLRAAEALPEPLRPDSNIASVYARLGDLDACFRWIEIALDFKRLSLRRWLFDPTVANVRADPRFRALLAARNLLPSG
jgi:adenylate cyclase